MDQRDRKMQLQQMTVRENEGTVLFEVPIPTSCLGLNGTQQARKLELASRFWELAGELGERPCCRPAVQDGLILRLL